MGSASDDRIRTPKDTTPMRRDASGSQDRTPQAESRSLGGSLLPNGRGVLKAAGLNNTGSSPLSRSHGEGVNGHRSSSTGASKGTSMKNETTSAKSFVPPLLSPLRLGLAGTDSPNKAERKKREEDGEYNKVSKTSRLDAPAPAKKQKSPLKMPPLLSPSLPPTIESAVEAALLEDLDKLKKTPSKKTTSQGSIVVSDSPGSGKKSRTDTVDLDAPQSRIVTLKFSKKHRKDVQRLLALPPKKDPLRNERSVSTEAPPVAAKKRPAATTEVAASEISAKRPRTAETALQAKLAAPSTPSARTGSGTAMARIGSNHSQVNTPGEANNNLTPGAPASQERPPTSHDGATAARILASKARHEKYVTMGRKLKHRRDHITREYGTGPEAAAAAAEDRLAAFLGLESVMSFMVGFGAFLEVRHAERRQADASTWQSTMVMLKEVQHRVRSHRGLTAIALQLQALCAEQLMRCFWYAAAANADVAAQQALEAAAAGNPTAPTAANLIRFERERVAAWRLAQDAVSKLERSQRLSVGPWSGVDETVAMVLRVMRSLAEEEGCAWTSTLGPAMAGALRNGSREGSRGE